MDFSQFLQQYLDAKRLRGVTPGRGASQALFAPYFNRQYDVNMAGRRQDLAERAQTFTEKRAGEGLAWSKENAIQTLALQKWQDQMMREAAARGDTKSTIGNVLSTAGGLGQLALLKKYGYFDRRY